MGKYTLLRKEMLTETQILYEGLEPLVPQYTALELIDRSEQQPATKDLMRYFFSDANEDGYTHILIWKRHYQALPSDDPQTTNGDFFLEHEKLEVMSFDPQGLTFSAPMRLDDIGLKRMGDILFH
jgi:hypothetical protein